jgi:hypothetical protein
MVLTLHKSLNDAPSQPNKLASLLKNLISILDKMDMEEAMLKHWSS